jgi:hypothetical protein
MNYRSLFLAPLAATFFVLSAPRCSGATDNGCRS